MATAINTDFRAGRMLDAMLDAENKKARVDITVSIFDGDERRLHQTFRFSKWSAREGHTMLSVELNDGDWDAGVRRTKVAHIDARTMTVKPARGMNDQLLVYAAKAALQYMVTGDTPQPRNGRVVAQEEAICGCCGRKLTHPDSILLGIGPECKGKANSGVTIRSRRAAVVQHANREVMAVA